MREKDKEKRHKRSSSQMLNLINRTPAPVAVLVGIFLGLVLARFWFGPVRTFESYSEQHLCTTFSILF